MHIDTLTSLNIREFTAADYADVARLHNANFAEFSMTPDEFLFEDEHRPAHCRWARWVAECDGRLVGYGTYDQSPQVYHPRKFHIEVNVDPEFFGRGIGRQLYDLVLGEIRQFDPLSVDDWTRVDWPRRVGFLERRGFVEDMRLWTSTLDLTRFDPRRFADQVTAVEAQGIELRSWAELGVDDPTAKRRIFEMWLAVREDVPMPPTDQRTETSFEEWTERTMRPDLLPGGYFVAIDDEQYAGTSQLWRSPSGGELRTGMTGIRREYRRRGIALALKVRSLEWAKEQGYVRVATENEINNRGMIAINDLLGFVKHPAYAHYLKTFVT